MLEPTMRWFFEPRRDGNGARPGDDDSAPGLISVPAALLQRHGALLLDPGKAAVVAGWPAPRPTIYRARTLLVPNDLLADPDFVRAVNQVLARVGITLRPPGRDTPPPQRDLAARERGNGPLAEVLQQLHRTAVLVPARGRDGEPPRLPVVIDAYTAQQALRSAASAREFPVLSEQAVRRISLEHLLIGSAITGSPATDGGGITGSPATDGGGITGPGSTDSYLFGGPDARVPVDLYLDAPARRSPEQCVARCGRRPVMAVLDTGVREHPWLDVELAGGGYTTVSGGFVAVSPVMQDSIRVQEEAAVAAGDKPRQILATPWDRPVTSDPLIGELSTHTGHGVFIAGIVRQIVPDAQVLALRIMCPDGVVYEGTLVWALKLIAERVSAALAGDMSQMIDVVSLSLGYFSETSADQAYTTALWPLVSALLDMGVVVTAAAGNYATSRRFYPAAFADLVPPGQVPVISVGALNPNGSKALFSDGGGWVRAWAPGAAVISTYPADVNGDRDPEVSVPGPRGGRAALDPDDYRAGFAIWSGSSFSAPMIGAVFLQELMAGAAADPALRLDDAGAGAAVSRSLAALSSLGWEG